MRRSVKFWLFVAVVALCATAYCAYVDSPKDAITPQHDWSSSEFRRRLEDPKNLPLWLSWKPESYFSEPSMISASRSIMDGNMDRLREILDADLNVNATGTHNMTLLFWAFMCDKLKAFELLLERGANPDIPLTRGFGVDRMYARFYEKDTVLFAAARRYWQSLEFVEVGVPYSRDVNKHGAGDDSLIDVAEGRYMYDSLLQALIEAGVDINSTDVAGNNFVTGLIISQNYKCAQFLLDAGADPRFGPEGIERFWRAFENQRSFRMTTAEGQRELEQIRQTVLQRLIDDPDELER